MWLVILIIFPFMLLAELLKQNHYCIYPAYIGAGFSYALYRRPVMPCIGLLYCGYILYIPVPLRGLVGLYGGHCGGVIYWGLFLCPLSRVPVPAVVRVRFCWALLRACPLPRFHWGIFY